MRDISLISDNQAEAGSYRNINQPSGFRAVYRLSSAQIFLQYRERYYLLGNSAAAIQRRRDY